MATVYKQMLQNALKREEEEKEMTTKKDAMVKCPTCGDVWHTRAAVGEAEACTDCGDYFYVEQSDVVKEFDVVGFIMAYEGGGLDDDAIIEGFQHLIDTGTAWILQGSYGRMAAQLIELGYCTPKEEAQ